MGDSSVVNVRLDGFDGRQGNYHVVESVLPLMRRPVRQRFVNASVLHLQKLKHVMRGDVFLFASNGGEENMGRIVEVNEDLGTVAIQPIEVEPGEQYGPLERRPWAPVGERRDIPLADAKCRCYLEEGNYLRDVSIADLRALGLLRNEDEQEHTLEIAA